MPPFTHVVWDDDLEKRPDVARIIERGQVKVLQEFADYAKERILPRAVIERFHRTIFAPVFPRGAGKTRGSDPDLMYDVEIGNAAMGTAHTEVAREFEACSAKLGTCLTSLDANVMYPLGDDHFAAVLRVAWWRGGCMGRSSVFTRSSTVMGAPRASASTTSPFAGLRLIPVGNPRRYDYFEANRLFLRTGKTTAYEDRVGAMMRPTTP